MEDEKSLRSAVIRLASANPELRPHLLPILAKTASVDEEFEAILEDLEVNNIAEWTGDMSSKDLDDICRKLGKQGPKGRALLDIIKKIKGMADEIEVLQNDADKIVKTLKGGSNKD